MERQRSVEELQSDQEYWQARQIEAGYALTIATDALHRIAQQLQGEQTPINQQLSLLAVESD